MFEGTNSMFDHCLFWLPALGTRHYNRHPASRKRRIAKDPPWRWPCGTQKQSDWQRKNDGKSWWTSHTNIYRRLGAISINFQQGQANGIYVSSSSSELPRSPRSWRICPDLPGFSQSLPGHLISQKNRKSRRWISKRSENVPPWLSRNYQKQRCAPTRHAQPFPQTHDEIAVPLPCAKWNLHYDTQIRKNLQSNWHAARFGPWSFRGPKCCTWQFSCHPAIQLQVRLSDIPVERLRSSYMYPIQNINLQP